MKIKLQDISRSELVGTQYDFIFIGLGYEPRCTYVSRLLDENNVKHAVLFSFAESRDNKSRLNSLDDLIKKWGAKATLIELEHSNIHAVYQEVNNLIGTNNDKEVTILVDYSSMSRNWYSAILNYCLRVYDSKLIIDLVYSSAEYPINEDFFNFELGDVKILPGCEGSSITKMKKCAIFMLGFDNVGPQSFFNLLEPEITFGVIASPGALPDYEKTALSINQEFIDHQLSEGKNLLRLPISSVATTFEQLCQLIQPLRQNHNITIIQFGPKPHIIASTLAGIFFENVSCIYSEYSRSKPFDVIANGELVITRIITSVSE